MLKIKGELAIGERCHIVSNDSQLPDVFCPHSRKKETQGWLERMIGSHNGRAELQGKEGQHT
jgi:hypothetical protein